MTTILQKFMQHFITFFTRTKKDIALEKEEDLVKPIQDPQPSDRLILLVGGSGAGKSTFINLFLDTTEEKAARSTTKVVQAFQIPDSELDYRVFLVDTPGFRDAKIEEAIMLKHVCSWLQGSYGENKRIDGVIFCQEITAKWRTPAKDSMKLFKKLCGEDLWGKTVFLQTKWDTINKEQAEGLEKRLKGNWQKMIQRGAVAHRQARLDKANAQETVAFLLAGAVPQVILQIQKELVQDHKQLTETAVWKAMNEGDELLRRSVQSRKE